jgi:PmbA protein
MIDQIKEIIENLDTIDAWLIEVNRIQSEELFLIKDKIDMNRAKDITKYHVTVYVDHGENKKYRGSSTTLILPGMNSDEIIQRIVEASLSASFVENLTYPLAQASSEKVVVTQSSLSTKPLSDWVPEIVDALYKKNILENTNINSSEIFVTEESNQVINSNGINLKCSNYNVEVEVIIDSVVGTEAVEVFDVLTFSEFDADHVTDEIERLLRECEDRAIASPMPAIHVPVVLSQESVKRFFNYYLNKSSAQMIFEGISQWTLGSKIQGDTVTGDLITARGMQQLNNSPYQVTHDKNGILLHDTTIIENGVLKAVHGSNQYAHYLNLPATGQFKNVYIKSGKHSESTWLSKPHLNCIAFSDFQLNPVTGDFGGELRLAYYFDGTTTRPVTGGSISGNVQKIAHEIYLSSELKQNASFLGPKSIMIPDLTIAGA